MTLEELKEKMKNDLTKDYKKRYFEGAIDTLDAIQKALVEAKNITGQYPSVDVLVYKLLPEMKEMRKKDLQELKDDQLN